MALLIIVKLDLPRLKFNRFLYVGRLSEEKNLKRLIDVFNDLPYQLTIIGEGPELEY